MQSKIIKALRSPVYFLYAAQKILRLNPSRSSRFNYLERHQSDSDNGFYLSAVKRSVISDRHFTNFKQDPIYKTILEHVSKDLGWGYLSILSGRGDEILAKALVSVLRSDGLGNPDKYRYEGMDIMLSPTTLRYVKVSSDLRGLFGSTMNNVAEIGCGYGGQAYANDQLLNICKVTLFDLPIVNELIEKYLERLLFNGAYEVKTINQTNSHEFDLIISNYAFSELPSVIQKKYIEKIISKSKRGYLTMNSGIGGVHSNGKLSLSELRQLLPPFKVYEEHPVTADNNYIVVWGHDENFAKQHLNEIHNLPDFKY